ncbi:MAG: hypothetical protein ACLR3O_06145 [Streptococcus sp.]
MQLKPVSQHSLKVISRVPMNDDVPATFDDGSTTKTVDGVGTYTVANRRNRNLCSRKSFVGTAPAVTVVREDNERNQSLSNLHTNSNSSYTNCRTSNIYRYPRSNTNR